MDNFEQQIYAQAKFSTDLTYEKIPSEVIERAKNVILDSVGCVLKGFRAENAMEECMLDSDEGIITLALAMISTELYEGNRKAIGHPACHILPLMFSQASKGTMTYQQFLVNFIAAYEVASRWGSSITFSHDILGHGTVMTAGAVVAEGLYHHVSTEEMYEALLITGSLPEVSVWQSVWDGSALHDAYAGISATKAKKSYFLYANGVRSTGKIVQNVYQNIMGANIKEEKLSEGLNENYYLMTNYYKVHTGCRFIHPFADIMQRELENGLDKSNIEKIDLYTYKKAARLTAQKVPNKLAGQFSIPVSIATQIEKGELSPDTIEMCVNNPEITAWEGKITLYEDEKYNKLLPNTRGARVELTLKTGEKKKIEIFHAIGDFDHPNPFTTKLVTMKFKKNTMNMLSESEVNELIENLLDQEEDKDMNQVMHVFYTKISSK